MQMLKLPQILFAPAGESGAGAGAPSSAGGSAPASSPAPAAPPASSGESGAGASSPPSGASPSPATPADGSPAPASPPSAGDSFFEFPELDAGDEEFDLSPQPPAEATPPSVVPPPQTPTPPPQEQQTPAPAEAASPAAPATPPAPGPQEASPLPTPAEPDRIAQALLSNHDAIVDHLAATEFKLSDEEVKALEEDATSAIPKLLSRLYVKANVNMLQQVAKIIPAMAARDRTIREANDKNMQKFYSRWPDLNAEKHGGLVMRNAALYRRMHPEASLDQMIEELGPIVMVAAKVQPGAPAPQGNAIVPPVPGARLVAPTSPFRPAGSGVGTPPKPGYDDNPWSGLANSQDDDE